MFLIQDDFASDTLITNEEPSSSVRDSGLIDNAGQLFDSYLYSLNGQEGPSDLFSLAFFNQDLAQ